MTWKHSKVYKYLKEYDPKDLEESFVKEKMLEFLQNFGSHSFSRECLLGHFTASSFLLNDDLTSICFGLHSKMNIWLILGGHLDSDDDPLFVSIKEAKEESGINEITPISDKIFDIEMYLIPEYKNIPAHYHFDITFLLQAHNNNFIQNEEMKDLKWVHAYNDQLPTIERSGLRMLQKWKDLK